MPVDTAPPRLISQAHKHLVKLHESHIAPIARMPHAISVASTLRKEGWHVVYEADPELAVWEFATDEQYNEFMLEFTEAIIPLLSYAVAKYIYINYEWEATYEELLKHFPLADDDDDSLLPLGVPCAG
jgi:hypothetical protein